MNVCNNLGNQLKKSSRFGLRDIYCSTWRQMLAMLVVLVSEFEVANFLNALTDEMCELCARVDRALTAPGKP